MTRRPPLSVLTRWPLRISSGDVVATLGIGLWGALFFIPLLSAAVVIVLPSLGYEPSLLTTDFSIEHWKVMVEDTLFQQSLLKTLFIGWSSAIIALIGAVAISALFYAYARNLIKWLAVFMAIPHAAFALGFSFLLAPVGLFVRLGEAVGMTGVGGYDSPLIVLDDWGVSLVIVLVLKELPFLCFIILGSFKNHEMENLLLAVRSLGYSRFAAWRRVIAPLLFVRIRLAFYIVLSYSLSVVDMSIIVGPQQPPTLSLMLLEMFNSGDTAMRFQACAGALILGGIILISVGFVRLIEWGLLRLSRVRLPSGKRRTLSDTLFHATGWVSAVLLVGLTMSSLAVNLIWSVAKRWSYPDLLPTAYTFKYWRRALFPEDFSLLTADTSGGELGAEVFHFAALFSGETLKALLALPLVSTVIIACISAGAALVASLFFLEASRFFKRRFVITGLYSSFFIPLLLPETILLFGITFMAVLLSLHANVMIIAWAHFLYTFPYLLLTLRGPYASYDDRYTTLGHMLSRSVWRTYILIKLPMLARSMAVAFAIAFSVSVAQYLSTELIGGGRLVTITTEAVNLSAGLNRRIIGVYAVLQMLLPMTVFLAVFTTFPQRQSIKKSAWADAKTA